MSSLPFDPSSSWDNASSGHHGSGHHGSSPIPHHHTPHHTFQGDHTHSGSHSSSHSHFSSHQGWQQSSAHGGHGAKAWDYKPYQASTSSSFSSSGIASGKHYSSYSSAAGHQLTPQLTAQLTAQSHHVSQHLVMNCSSSDDVSVVKIWSDGDIWWHGTSKGSLQGIYIKNHVGNIVAKFVDHRVLLWSGDRYVDVGYARNAQEAVYDVCVKYHALGT